MLVDIAQIRIFEDNYRALDNHVDYLIPFIGLQFNNLTAMALQIYLEDKIHTFYQNLSEQEQLKVICTLAQFLNNSFLNAMNRSKIFTNNNSINQALTKPVLL